ncbi:MAG: hypothetical protein MUE63_09390 [Xanthomonadales bacterium]|nr:hypothetical protein [Xanthomonadales bacterium]
MNRCGWKKVVGIGIFTIITLLLLPCAGAAANPADPQQAGGITGRVFLDENADTEFKECDCDCGMDDIPVRLYRDHCGGLIVQTAHTDAEGYFHFAGLDPGDYCVMPMPKFICEGFQPTKSITQKVTVKPGETVKAEWFGFDHFLDVNE